MKIWLMLGLALGFLATTQAQAPHVEIANARIHAKLYVPDDTSGYYRATRFDWAGVISSLNWNGHSYFGQWFELYDPTLHDAIMGPVEEFSGLGYDEAKPGDSFVRIGVGGVRKPDEPGYRRFSTYEIVDPGKRIVHSGSDWVEFIHELRDVAGYGYVYRKKVRLHADTLVLEHHLENTGRKTIVTSVYEHDFFMLDNRPTGPDVIVRFPFNLTAVSPLNGIAEIRGKDFVYLKELQARQFVQTELQGFGPSSKDYDIRVENRTTGAGVRQTGDRPMSKINLWSPRTTVCPEAYVDLRIESGKNTSWKITYEFYQVPGVGKK